MGDATTFAEMSVLRVRSGFVHLSARGITPHALAKEAGVDKRVCSGIGEPDWAPARADALILLEQAITRLEDKYRKGTRHAA